MGASALSLITFSDKMLEAAEPEVAFGVGYAPRPQPGRALYFVYLRHVEPKR